MHRTRVVRVKRFGSGVRTVATAPSATLQRRLGKWAAPESSRADTAAPAASQGPSSWARPPQNGGAPGYTPYNKWARSPPASAQPRRPPSSSTPNAYGNRWQRPRADSPVLDPAMTRSRMPDSKTTRSTSSSESVPFQRGNAPHLAPRTVYDDLARSTTPRPYTSKTVDRQQTERTASTRPEAARTSEQRPRAAWSPVVHVEEEESDTRRKDTRGAKSARNAFKERGSIASRISEGVTIPSHSRVKADPMAASKKREKKFLGAPKKVARDIFIPSVVSVGNLARLLNVRLERLQGTMLRAGMREQSSYDHILTSEYASLIAMEYNRNPVVNDEAAFDIFPPVPYEDPLSLPSRPPVVTIMGHVDHGKTTLLDTLRSTAVAKGEAGGITQHIGAFSVPVPASPDDPKTKRVITFLDTPGHAAFSAMRARGASVTDIVVLVVAADDGIMPQTREVLELVKKDAGKVGLVVAINKIDKPAADVHKVETALFAEGVQLESFGGDVPCVHVSGLSGEGLPQLVETISLLAEIQDVRAETSGQVQGYVLESRVHKGLGNVATVLVARGELKAGTHLIAGTAHGKVRLLTDSLGASLKSVLPGNAAVVSGWKELPGAGDEVLSGSESDVKRALANRVRKAAEDALVEDAEAINESRREERERRAEEEASSSNSAASSTPTAAHTKTAAEEQDGKKELRIVLKGDVSGSVEAVEGALQGIGNQLAGVKIVATGVGDVSESDVLRAKAVDGIVVAFSVNVPRSVEQIAVSQGVSTMKSSIIYQLMDMVKQKVVGLLPVVIEKKVTGEANVVQLFDITIKGKQTMKVAGCRIINGIVDKNKTARVVRNGETVFEGKLKTLRHLKKDIMEAGKGLECGMAFEGWDELRDGDLVQSFLTIEKPGTL